MAEKPNIDYAHATACLDTVHGIATIAPRYTNLLNLAMSDLKEMDEQAKEYSDAVAKEQAVAKAEAAAEEQARIEAEAEATGPRAIPAKTYAPDTADVAKRRV